ncbi:MAG: hypothetical protein QXQ25_03290 [Thermoplasmata archaeon]
MKKLMLISIVLTIVLLLMPSSVVVAKSPTSNQIPAGYFKGAYADYKEFLNFSILPNGTYPNWTFPIYYQNYTITSINASEFSLHFIFSYINNYNITPIKYITQGNETILLPSMLAVSLNETSTFSNTLGPVVTSIPSPPPFLNTSTLTLYNRGYNSGKELNNTTVYSNQQYTGPLGSFKVDIVKYSINWILGKPAIGSEYKNETWVYDSYTGIEINYTYTMNLSELWKDGYSNMSSYTELINTNMPLSDDTPNYLLIGIVSVVIAVPIIVIAIDRKKIFKSKNKIKG